MLSYSEWTISAPLLGCHRHIWPANKPQCRILSLSHSSSLSPSHSLHSSASIPAHSVTSMQLTQGEGHRWIPLADWSCLTDWEWGCWLWAPKYRPLAFVVILFQRWKSAGEPLWLWIGRSIVLDLVPRSIFALNIPLLTLDPLFVSYYIRSFGCLLDLLDDLHFPRSDTIHPIIICMLWSCTFWKLVESCCYCLPWRDQDQPRSFFHVYLLQSTFLKFALSS